MNDHTHRLPPEEAFPEDLAILDDTELEVLNSRLHRELDEEYAHVNPQLETVARLEEVNLELNRREGLTVRAQSGAGDGAGRETDGDTGSIW